MEERFKKRIDIIESKAKELGFDFFPIQWEVVSEEIITEIASYGLPTRPRHWSFGQSYEYQKLNGEMGYSKIYELILNSNPSYAFMLNTNSEAANLLIAAHCYGHSCVFKNNYLFKKTDRNMVYHAAEHAERIDAYIEQYGLQQVEHIMDIGFAFERNIDWGKGLHRDRYQPKKKYTKKVVKQEFDDILNPDSPSVQTIVENSEFPPHPEYDMLWFLINYSNLEDWQKDILSIIREESFYFYPQFVTKILNEGLASLAQTEIISALSADEISATEYLDFCKLHEKVVQPGGNQLNINPYFLGFTILYDIKNKWDEKYKSGESSITGLQKVLEVVSEEDDISFIKNYLTQEIVNDLGLFAYRKFFDKNRAQFLEIESRKVEDVAENLVKDLYHYRSPLIAITKASADGLELEHHSTDLGTLDIKHLKKTMGYLHEIWGGVIDIKTADEGGSVIHYTFDEEGLSHTAEEDDSDYDTFVPP